MCYGEQRAGVMKREVVCVMEMQGEWDEERGIVCD